MKRKIGIGSRVALLVLLGVLLFGKLWEGLREELAYEFVQSLYRNFLPCAVIERRTAVETAPEKTGNITLPEAWQMEIFEENHPIQEQNDDPAELSGEKTAAAQETGEEAEEERPQQIEEPEPFTLHEKVRSVSLETLSGYENLVKQFYTIDKSTMVGSDQLDAAALSQVDLTINRDVDGPEILLYHTHSQEGYADSVSTDGSDRIVGVGEVLAQILEKRYGYRVLHHTGQYDVKTRDDAYANALPELEALLKENPGIQVVIDLHRDEMPGDTRLVTNLDGRPTAKFMFFNGLSRTKRTGNLDYLKNEYQKENLAFSFQMKRKAEEYYPGLTRKIYLKGYRYNMHLCPRTLLVELGAQNNTYEEAVNACEPLAHLLDMVLSGNG